VIIISKPSKVIIIFSCFYGFIFEERDKLKEENKIISEPPKVIIIFLPR